MAVLYLYLTPYVAPEIVGTVSDWKRTADRPETISHASA